MLNVKIDVLMKKIKLQTVIFLLPILLCSCNDNSIIYGGESTPIGFETASFEVPNIGGTILISAENSEWGILGCYKMIDGEMQYIKTEFNVINGVNHYKDTVVGDWYSIYKKENELKIVALPNIGEEERVLLIDCNGPYRLQEILTVIQK